MRIFDNIKIPEMEVGLNKKSMVYFLMIIYLIIPSMIIKAMLLNMK